MGTQWDRRKGNGHPPPDRSARDGITLRTERPTPRVGAVAWECFRDYEYTLAVSDVVNTFTNLRKVRHLGADLILCSGVKVYPDSESPEEWASPPTKAAKEIAGAAGCPVLLEWRPSEEDRAAHRWLLATHEGFQVVRRGQYVFRANAARTEVANVFQELRNGYGQITLVGPDRSVHLLLLICGEARIFRAHGTEARLRYEWGAEELPGIFGGPWTMLHPSHDPYYTTSRYWGFGLVGPWLLRRDQRPREALFSILTRQRMSSDRRVVLPSRVIHAGAWQSHTAHERPYAVSLFPRNLHRDNEVLELVEEEDSRVRYAEFEV